MMTRSWLRELWFRLFAILAVSAAFVCGCRSRPLISTDCPSPRCSEVLTQIETPDLCDDACLDSSDLLSGPPMTISTFYETESWDLTLEEAIELALRSSKVLQKVGGVVVTAPQAAATLYDVAINETAPQGSVEAALAAFDAQVSSSLFFDHRERKFNNPFQSLFSSSNTNSATFSMELAKTAASGTRFAARNLTDYTNNQIPPGVPSPFRFDTLYNTVNQFEIRQPLLRGSGVTINRIAGPNAIPGVYSGVLIARIRSDITMADFEASVRDLVRDVERNYWELYYAYRDLDAKLTARESARKIWETRQFQREVGAVAAAEEAQARQQYFNFQIQVQNALSGSTLGQLGVLGSERNLRRLLGLPVNDGRILRPVSAPAIAPVVFDWETLQNQALDRVVEIRRQKWTIKQRELELLAAKQLNVWRLDAVGQYGFRGFGDELFGERDRPEGSAVADMFTSRLDDWQIGFELQGPLGNRIGHLAVRNAELRLIREKTLYREQQRQVLHDLGASYTEVDRALAAIKTAYNSQAAVREEYELKKSREEIGRDPIFFLLDAQQRLATAETAFFRSVVDYNVALMGLTYSAGGLLDRYNIYLEEGDWDNGLQIIADRKASQFSERGSNGGFIDIDPISAGTYPQNIDVPSAPAPALAPLPPENPPPQR